MTTKPPHRRPGAQDVPEADRQELVQDSLGLQLRLALRGLRQAFRHRLAQDGIPWSVWYALRALWKTEGLSQGELAERVGVLQPNVATAIRQMQQLGLILVEREPQDRRKLRIYLTPQAKALKKTLLPDVEQLNDMALRDFSTAERAELSRLLAKLYRNVEAYAEPAQDEAPPALSRGGRSATSR
jgi:DNA-binding MarR family transcriptional regulator